MNTCFLFVNLMNGIKSGPLLLSQCGCTPFYSPAEPQCIFVISTCLCL